MSSVASAAPGPCPTPRELVQHGRLLLARCGRRSCPSCGVLWLHDTRIRTLAACHELSGPVALITVTAPGADVLPWDASGKRVALWYAKHWNATAPARWSALHRAAARAARREAAEQKTEWRLLVKTWEYQHRGVLHLHLIVPADGRGEFAASTVYVNELANRARAHGFGFVDRGKLPESGARRSARRLSPVAAHRAAAYVASYVASTGAGKEGISEVARKQGVPGAVVYVAQALTRRSGITMRSLRDRRRVACRYPEGAATPESWRAACVCDAIERRRAPLTAGARRALHARALAERWSCSVDLTTGEVRTPTPAPAPRLPAGDRCRVQEGTAVGLVRLDSVLHGGHDPRLQGWWTIVCTTSSRPVVSH